VSKTTAIMSLTNPLFVLIADVSHMTRTTDLQSCGETTVLVKRVGSFVTDNEEQNYSEVIDMEEVIEKYHDTYAKDLEERLCLQKDKLPTAMAISTLLNTNFGLRPRIVGCGLMSDRQYDQTRRDLVRMIQDMLDARSPTIDVELLASDNDDRDSGDEVLPITQNINYNLADKEVSDFESFKCNAYWLSFAKKEEGQQGCIKGVLRKLLLVQQLPMGGICHWVKICLTTLMNKDGCVLFASLKTTRIGSQTCGFLCNGKHLVKWWRLVVCIFWVFLGTFLPHSTQGLESGTMSRLLCLQAL
jgi:hypothetical protein